MLAMHLFYLTPTRAAGTAQFNLYSPSTTIKTVVGGDVCIRGGDMSIYDTVTGLPVLVDQTNVGVNQ